MHHTLNYSLFVLCQYYSFEITDITNHENIFVFYSKTDQTMTTEVTQNYCFICGTGKEKVSYKCDGCSKRYCRNHLRDHEKELDLQFDQIENERNIVRQTLSEIINQPINQEIIQQINLWEQKSIDKIKQTAELNRQIIFKLTNEHFQYIELYFETITERIRKTKEENDFNEIHLDYLKTKLVNLKQKLNDPPSILLKENHSTSFINKIYIDNALRKLTIS